MNTKAITSFITYTDAEISPLALTIHTELTENAATFGTLPVLLPALDALIEDYDIKLAAKTDRSKSANVSFNAAKDALLEALSKLGNHVNNVAQGDPVIVDQSGFPSYTTERTPKDGPPLAPENLRVKHGVVSGSVIVRYKPDRSPSTNEVQINKVNPDTEAEWRQYGIFQGGTAEITGLTPGTLVWIRVRTVGLKGVMGAWSDPAQIRVL